MNPSQAYTALTLWGRGAEAADVAGPIAFPASEDACYITGMNLAVNDGLSASN